MSSNPTPRAGDPLARELLLVEAAELNYPRFRNCEGRQTWHAFVPEVTPRATDHERAAARAWIADAFRCLDRLRAERPYLVPRHALLRQAERAGFPAYTDARGRTFEGREQWTEAAWHIAHERREAARRLINIASQKETDHDRSPVRHDVH